MRLAIPNPSAVETAFRSLSKKLARTHKRVNAAAARELKAGAYDAANAWMDVGRRVAEFAGRVGDFAQEWDRLVKAVRLTPKTPKPARGERQPRSGTRSKTTPAWQFCQPLLRALVGRGGAASLPELIGDLERSDLPLTDRDRAPIPSKGIPRWHRSVRSALRQAQREGWVAKARDGSYAVTAKGKTVADQPGKDARTTGRANPATPAT
jgi:hypothetical protein